MVVSTNICVLCHEAEKSSQHLFIECAFAQRVWCLCFRWIDILFVQHKVVDCHFEHFHLPFFSTKQNQVWKGLWAAVVRSIWEQRNELIFKQGIPNVEEIFQKTQLKSWFWLKYRAQAFCYSFSDWILNPILCIKSYV